MSKHTPGPWFLSDWSEDDGPNKDVIEAREPEILLPGQSSIWPNGIRCLQIASVADSSCDASTTQANARLIAAAPELLEALRQIRMDANEGAGTFGPDWACQAILRTVDAVIAEAIGPADE